MKEAPICKPGGKGLVLPWNDYDWPAAIRAVLYVIGLVYCFLGVAIVADMFMAAIEAITKRRRRKTLNSGQVVTVYVWNDTVANLSLMALGSSAPEIFLSLIDLLRKGMRSSELGSATIVGSAAFNLLVIVSVCVMCIPSGEVRIIEQYSVFIATGIFSLFAYLWLAFILVVNSPNMVEVWEAVATLLFLPILIYVSYLADIGKIGCGAKYIVGPQAGEEEKASNEEAVRQNDASKQGDAPMAGAASKVESHETGRSEEQASQPTFKSCLTPRNGQLQAAPKKQMSFADADLPSLGDLAGKRQVSPLADSDIKSAGEQGILTLSMHGSDARLESDSHSERHSVCSSTSSRKGAVRLARGFSMNRLDSEIGFSSEETSAKEYRRRKSIAAHHNIAINRLRKSVTGGTGLGRTSSWSLASPRSDGLEQQNETTVQMLIDRMFVSPNLSKKIVKLVRTGAPSVGLNISYSVDRCKEPTARLTSTKIAVAKYPYQDTTVNEAPVEWLETMDTEEVTTGVIKLPIDRVETQLVVPSPGARQDGSCNDFIVSLLHVEISDEMEGPRVSASLGHIRSSYVICEKEANSGMLSFPNGTLEVPAKRSDQTIEVVVIRPAGCMGQMTFHYETESLSAIADMDYVETSGNLSFAEGITELTIPITIYAKLPNRAARDFLLILSAEEEDEDGAVFDPSDDGGEDSAILTITIGELETTSKSIVRDLDAVLNLNHWIAGFEDWKGQFKTAIFCNGSLEAQAEASLTDWLFHILSLPWMLIFAFIPPTAFCGGWLCFYVCLVFIGGATAIIADLAELFGCVLEVPDIVTAITFVALGTSMPDLFASKVAATEDATADASIVNVTGSNSVNVFLGLGLPWTMAAIYWVTKTRDEDWIHEYPDIAEMYEGSKCVFAVPAANLGFSIVCFCVASVGAICLLVARRRLAGGELGGPQLAKVATAIVLICYWVGYVSIVSWRALRYGKASRSEELGVIGGIFASEIILTAIPFCLLRRAARGSVITTPSASNDSQAGGDERTDAVPGDGHGNGEAGAAAVGEPGTVPGGDEDALRGTGAAVAAPGLDTGPNFRSNSDMPPVPCEPEASKAKLSEPRRMRERRLR